VPDPEGLDLLILKSEISFISLLLDLRLHASTPAALVIWNNNNFVQHIDASDVNVQTTPFKSSVVKVYGQCRLLLP